MALPTSKGARMLADLRKGQENFRECEFPGLPEMRMVIVPLFCDELQDSQASAEARFKDLKIEITLLTADDFNSELHLQILARALRDPDDPTRAKFMFADAADLRRNS